MDGAWHIAPVPHAGVRRARARCSKKTHTQRHETLVVRTCIVERHDGTSSGTLVQGQRPGRSDVDQAGPGPGSQTVTSFFERTNLSHDSSPSRFGISVSHGWEEPT